MSSYKPPVRSNKINRNFQIKVHLYFNPNSFNRSTDPTPRFYLAPIELLHVEDAAFSDKAEENGYVRYANNYWRYKDNTSLSESEVLSIYEKIKTSYPYGYITNDPASINKYIADVKENEGFQSFYKKYWENNSAKIIEPSFASDGTKEYPYSYIEFTINEIVTQKYTVGTVPALEDGLTTAAEYGTGTIYSEPSMWACNDDIIQVGTNGTRFSVQGIPHYSLKLQTSGKYRIDLMSDLEGYNSMYVWPTGGSYGGYSGYRFRLSTGIDGSHNGFSDYTNGVSYIETPEVGNFFTKVIPKTSYLGGNDDTHPYYYSGSSDGFGLSGSGSGTLATGINISGFGYDEAPLLTLRKRSTYYFNQYDSSNVGHPLYISTHPSGQGSHLYTSGVTHHFFGGDTVLGGSYLPGTTGYHVKFTVPEDAPSTLYYGCLNHAYMGGQINIISDQPPASYTGSIPQESILIDLSSNTEEKTIHYYSPDVSGMGGRVFIKNDCSDDVLFANY